MRERKSSVERERQPREKGFSSSVLINYLRDLERGRRDERGAGRAGGSGEVGAWELSGYFYSR